MSGSAIMDKEESVREMKRIYDNFMKKNRHTNEELKSFINAIFVTNAEWHKIMSGIVNEAERKNFPVYELAPFRQLFKLWADQALRGFVEKLTSEEAQIGFRLGA